MVDLETQQCFKTVGWLKAFGRKDTIPGADVSQENCAEQGKRLLKVEDPNLKDTGGRLVQLRLSKVKWSGAGEPTVAVLFVGSAHLCGQLRWSPRVMEAYQGLVPTGRGL